MTRGLVLALALAAALLGSRGASADAPPLPGEKPSTGLRAGAAAVKITPSLTRPVYIAGYDSNRVAESVHDDLWARAVVLDDGRTRMAVVSLDLIGLFNSRVRKIRSRIRSVPAENVLIATTHVHSGPDTMGMWGPAPLKTGLDPLYMARLEDRIVAAVDAAARDLQPVRLLAGKVDVPDGLVYNSREPIQDRTLTGLRFEAPGGRTVASVIHYGAHPEVNKSKALTSDFVHYVREAAEKRFGGVALFLNGALGGMVTPDVGDRHTFEEMRRVGEGVGRAAVEALARAEPVRGSGLRVARRSVELPIENDRFKLLLGLGVFDAEARDGRVATEVWRVDVGPVAWITIPGEILPKPALALKELMPGPFPMVVAMGNDELGYILDPADFDRRKYSYERSVSVGRQAWPLLFQAARELLR